MHDINQVKKKRQELWALIIIIVMMMMMIVKNYCKIASILVIWTAWFWGDPHINTLDGRMYSFNGLGEYTMLEYNNNDTFVLQARTGKAFNNSEPVETGTVFTGFAATQGITVVNLG